MSFVRDIDYIVTVPFTCQKCGHPVIAEIDMARPLCCGNQCPKCLELYPQEFTNAVIRAVNEFWKQT